MTIGTSSQSIPGVAFIVTSFNKERYLEHTLRSLLAQEGDFEREYIVVDDDSTDRSYEIAADIVGSLPNGKVLRQRNMGPANAQDHGVGVSTMPFLKFVDGDGVLARDCILRLAPAFDRPGVALVNGGGIEIADIANVPPIPRRGPPRFRYLFDELATVIRDSYAASSGALVRRDAYVASGGCDRRVFIQDYSFVHRLAVSHGLAWTDDPVVLIPSRSVRIAAGGHLGEATVQIEHDRNAILCGLLRDFPELPLAIRRLALRRAAGRAWKWARRINGARAGCDRYFWMNVLSYAPWLPDYIGPLRMTLGPYLQTGGVRVPTPPIPDDRILQGLPAGQDAVLKKNKNGAGGGI